MFENMTLTEALLMFWPVILLHFILAIWALVDLAKREKANYLPKAAWVLIILFVNLFGPIIYLAVGRGE